jgi:hypothetical protein
MAFSTFTLDKARPEHKGNDFQSDTTLVWASVKRDLTSHWREKVSSYRVRDGALNLDEAQERRRGGGPGRLSEK